MSCDWIHADLRLEQREVLVRAFQNNRRGASEAPPSAHQVRPFRILIGSTRLIGQGVTLNKANRLVLMEPGWHAEVEAQIADRVHRIGSRSDRCWFYRLINPLSSLERFLVQDQERQSHQQQLIDWFNQSHRTEHASTVELFLDDRGDDAEHREELDGVLDM